MDNPAKAVCKPQHKQTSYSVVVIDHLKINLNEVVSVNKCLSRV
jgi:hypothetical protein